MTFNAMFLAALFKTVTGGIVFLVFVHQNGVHIGEVSNICNWIEFGRDDKN